MAKAVVLCKLIKQLKQLVKQLLCTVMDESIIL